jgi:hypothetical protein
MWETPRLCAQFDSFADDKAWVVPGSGEWMADLLQKDGRKLDSLFLDVETRLRLGLKNRRLRISNSI